MIRYHISFYGLGFLLLLTALTALGCYLYVLYPNISGNPAPVSPWLEREDADLFAFLRLLVFILFLSFVLAFAGVPIGLGVVRNYLLPKT